MLTESEVRAGFTFEAVVRDHHWAIQTKSKGFAPPPPSYERGTPTKKRKKMLSEEEIDEMREDAMKQHAWLCEAFLPGQQRLVERLCVENEVIPPGLHRDVSIALRRLAARLR